MNVPYHRIEFILSDEAATLRFGEDFALAVQKGDLVTLSGDLGAGKTTLARALIRAVADDAGLEVPSPTFTLVQAYEALRLPLAHADLYRISSGEELDELGLAECLEDGAVLVEWPERGEGFLPEPAFAVTLSHEGAGRRVLIEGPEAAIARLERSLAIRAFLDAHDRADAERRYLQGDASPRKYETIRSRHGVEILMNAPAMPYDPPLRDGKTYRQIAHLAENILAFAAIDGLLASHGFRVPQMCAADLDQGFLILENLGTEGVRAASGEPVAERYEAAARFLAHLHGVQWPDRVKLAGYPDHIIAGFDRDAMMIEVSLVGQWYAPRMMGRPLTEAEKTAYEAAWDRVIADLADAEKSLLLRDYHSPNLFWFPEATGKDRIGIIDFQDAMIGPAAYDVASLALDARVTITPQLEQAVVAAYCDERRRLGHAFDEVAFRKAYAAMGAQRNAKLLGLFVRLDERDGKSAYLKHLPRIHDYLTRVLVHPVMQPVADWFRELGLCSKRRNAMKMPETAMVLAAGLGKRMRPVTDTMPKPLVPVAGRPLIDWGLDALAEAGVPKAVVNVHYLADQLVTHLASRAAPRITISDERDMLLDSAGGIVKALPELGAAPFFILNADTFWVGDTARPNLAALAEVWDDTRMDILLMTARLDQATGFDGKGDFVADAEGRLRRARDTAGEPLIYAGAGIIHPRIFADAEPGASSLNRYFDSAIAQGRLYAMPMTGHWLTVGTPQAIGEAEAALSALV